MADTTKPKIGFNAATDWSYVTTDPTPSFDVATLDSVYGMRAKPIYVSLDNAIATKPRRSIHPLLVFTEMSEDERNKIESDLQVAMRGKSSCGDVKLVDHPIIGHGTLQWAPLEVDEERLNQARQDLISKFASAGIGNLQSMRCDQSGSVVLPHDWPHESLLSSGEASQSPASESLKQTSPIYHKSYGSEVDEAIDSLFDACKNQDLNCTVDISPIPPKQEPHSLQSLPVNGDAVFSPVAAPLPAPPAPAPAPAYNIDSVVNFASLIPVAHAMALDKGWWQDGIASRDMNEIIANYHAEVSEAWEEYRAGRMETWTNTDGKPEGFWVEIADLLIRMADSCGAGKHGYSQSKFPETFRFIRTIASDITAIHWLISVECESVVEYCLKFSKRKKVDIFAIVRQKLAYNATRPHRHGGKKA